MELRACSIVIVVLLGVLSSVHVLVQSIAWIDTSVHLLLRPVM